ncbi:hypothetical protein MMC34_002219, partial [Xylographa carneopallida]|nr:hypothetical protein [Xylographa carneopallida]
GTRQLLVRDVLDVHLERDLPRIPWRSLRDDPTEARTGWNFIRDGRNDWPVDGEHWLWDRLARPQSSYGLITAGGGGDLDRRTIDVWMGRMVEFREKLLVLIHMTGGQPARGPELLSIRHSNTVQGEYRNVFVEDGAVVTVTRYHKGYTLKGDVKIIHRYLCNEACGGNSFNHCATWPKGTMF